MAALVHSVKPMFHRKIFVCFLLAATAIEARVFVRIGPPPVVVEQPAPTPGPGYVWTPGYYRWDGHAYVWVPGAWVTAPWPGAHWVPPHWVRRHGGWVFINGYWE